MCTDLMQQAEADENIKKLIIKSDEMWVCDTPSKQSTRSLHSRSQNLPQDWHSTAEGPECEGHACLLQLLKSECTIKSPVEVKQ